ncbi:MAG TPA: hypothetical protein VM243_14015 [Phycisphaerae bacterium]|nr:hypothetical protein [Phycisphaerae bacterium]
MIGIPDWKHVSESYIERQNLSLRMSQRRFTRLTNPFSKRAINHEHPIAQHYSFYNFVRRHKPLGTTPAVAAGVANDGGTVAGLVPLLEDEERKVANGGRISGEDRT